MLLQRGTPPCGMLTRTLTEAIGCDVLFFGPVLPHAGVVEGLISRDLGVAPAVPAAPDLRGWLLESA